MSKPLLEIEKYINQYDSLVDTLRSLGKDDSFIQNAVIHAVINKVNTDIQGEELHTFLQHLEWMHHEA